MSRQPKRKRGGQPGNRNAVKHGFYSVNMTLPQICAFWKALNLGSADPAIVALRIKLDSAFRSAPGNRRLRQEASRLLAKWYRSRYCLSGVDKTAVKKILRYMVDELNHDFTERIVAES